MKRLINECEMRSRNPNVPWRGDEIATDAARCRDAGTAISHFHARKPGAPETGESISGFRRDAPEDDEQRPVTRAKVWKALPRRWCTWRMEVEMAPAPNCYAMTR